MLKGNPRVVQFARHIHYIGDGPLKPVEMAFYRARFSCLQIANVRLRVDTVIFSSAIIKQTVIVTETDGKQRLFVGALSYYERARYAIATDRSTVKVLV